MTPWNLRLSRRQLVVGAAGVTGLGALLSACGNGSDGAVPSVSGPDESAPLGTLTVDEGFVIIQRYPPSSVATGQVRLTVSIADATATLQRTGPERLVGEIRNEDGNLVDQFEAPRRGSGLDVAYWAIETTIPARGLYDFRVDGAVGDPTPFIVFDPSEIAIPCVGDPLPPFATPTITDARGVDPVCTRLDGACPFHEVTLTEALASGKPVVYLIGTPAHCSTGTCAPGLDFLIEAAKPYADSAVFVHAEVYADAAATALAPAVGEYQLDYEPVLWITDAKGVVQRRIDIVWDLDEITAILADTLG